MIWNFMYFQILLLAYFGYRLTHQICKFYVNKNPLQRVYKKLNTLKSLSISQNALMCEFFCWNGYFG